MNQRYQNNAYRSLLWLVVFVFSGIWSNSVSAQTTISTESGTDYTGANGVTANGAVTFVIQNTTASPIVLKQVDYFWPATFNGVTPSLWYSTTSLSGTPNITSPTWTSAAVGTPLTVSSDGYLPTLTNLSVVIPANTQYRFALRSTGGIAYSGSGAVTPTPNTFTVDGVSLKVGNAQINGLNVGYGGAFPAPANNPRFFTGRIVFCPVSAPASTPVLSADTAVCAGTAANLRVTGGSLNTATEWKWYAGSCGGTPVGTGTSITVNPTATTTYYARGEGGCAPAGTCASVTVTVTPTPNAPIINPVSAICNGGVARLSINPLTVTEIRDSIIVNSSALSIAVPDNTTSGVSTNLTVPALPAGATVSSIDVTLNMAHTYPGDMIFNLRAPNGAIANLYKYNTGTFTGNAGGLTNAGWFNTVISSLSNLAFSTVAVAPFNYGPGPYAPDLLNSTVQGATVQNPNGFASSANAMSELFSTPQGVWTLAMADGGPGDVGTLTGWSIKIRYSTFQQTPASPAVWSPAATLFTDAAATTAYNGTTPTFEVYAKPSVTTTYSAASSANGCNSTPTTVNLTVNNPATIAAQPQAAAVCEFGTISFTVQAGGTTPSFQWQVNTGEGFVNVSNDDNYSGATTSTLTITNMPASWNGNAYRCVVTSLAPCTDVVNSNGAVLTVHPTPTVSLDPGQYTRMLPGLTTILSVSSQPQADEYAWFKDGLPFAAATGRTYTATIDDQGTYTVQVVDINGCTNGTNSVTIADSASSKLFIYPNPSRNNKFSVSYYSIKGNTLPRTLVIHDAKGALVLNKTYTLAKPYDRMDVDFSHLGKGIYFISLLDSSKKRIATGRVIVE